MLVVSNSCPTAPHLHSSSINMLETGKSATSPFTTPQSRQFDMPSSTSGLEQSLEPASPSNPISSASEIMTNSVDVEANQRTPYQYVPAGTPGTPGTPTNDEDSLPCKTEIPLMTTFPTKVPLSVLPDLASSAGDFEGTNDESSNSDVVSALILDDSRTGSQSFEFVEDLATDFVGKKGLNQEESKVKDMLLLGDTESIPVSMSPSPRAPNFGDDTRKPLNVTDSNTPRHVVNGDPVESVHLIQNIYSHSGSAASGEILLVLSVRFSVLFLDFD